MAAVWVLLLAMGRIIIYFLPSRRGRDAVLSGMQELVSQGYGALVTIRAADG